MVDLHSSRILSHSLDCGGLGIDAISADYRIGHPYAPHLAPCEQITPGGGGGINLLPQGGVGGAPCMQLMLTALLIRIQSTQG